MTNLLPFDGELYYFENFLNLKEQSSYLKSFLNKTEWEHDELMIYGKRIITSRKIAWYAEKNRTYTYSGKLKVGKDFTKELLKLKSEIAQFDNTDFNSCLMNLYHSGSEGMSWHSDNEKEIVMDSCIASISLGAMRHIDFKHKVNKTKIRIELAPGSLLLMKGQIQRFWLHSLPKTKKVNDLRVNLTFRLLNK